MPSFFIFAQNEPSQDFSEEFPAEAETAVRSREDFWISLGVDAGMYGTNSAAFGGGLSIGYGSGVSFGFKAVWFFSPEDLDTLELSLIFRFYLFGKSAFSGPFLQLMGGPSIFFSEGKLSIPSDTGAFSAGLCAGWRFIFSDRWFVEPSVRGGYPYLFAAGISAGARF